jgi:hypothetical protein
MVTFTKYKFNFRFLKVDNMDDIIKSQERKTPQLMLNNEKGLIEMKGSSIMEDATAFYEPIMKWLYEYVSNPKDTLVNVDLEYFNTSSAKVLLIIFKTLSNIQKSGCKVNVNWYYEEDDEEIFESGSNFSAMAKIPFNFIKK